METLLMAFMVWIGSHTAYDVSHVTIPRIEFHTQVELNHLYYSRKECKGGKPPNIAAAYTNKAGGTGHLNKKFNEKNPEDQSTLFHEIFHHVQHSNEAQMPKTTHAREAEAIAFENMWRTRHGLKKIKRQNLAYLCR